MAVKDSYKELLSKLCVCCLDITISVTLHVIEVSQWSCNLESAMVEGGCVCSSRIAQTPQARLPQSDAASVKMAGVAG